MKILYVFLWLFCVCLAQQELKTQKLQDIYDKADHNSEIVFKRLNSSIKYKDGVMILTCTPFQPLNESFQPISNMTVHFLVIKDCTFSTTSFKEQLWKLNINTDALKTLWIKSKERKVLQPGNYTQGLNIKHLIIEVQRWTYLTNNPNFLTPLTQLTLLSTNGIYMQPIPSHILLETLSFTSPGNSKLTWSHCEHLKELQLEHMFSVKIPKTWKKSCRNIRKLALQDLANFSFVNDIYTNGLELLEISDSYLEELPKDILWSARNTLTQLNLSMNSLKENSLLNFIDLHKVTDLDLSYNYLDGTALHEWSKYFQNLRNLNLEGNSFYNNFCLSMWKYSNQISAQLLSLERLSLNRMKNVSLDCLAPVHFAKLEYLGLAAEVKQYTHLQVNKIVQTNATQLNVDLKGRRIEEIGKHTYGGNTLFNTGKLSKLRPNKTGNIIITLSGAEIDCDCRNYWLAIYARDDLFPVNLIDFKCHTGVAFKEETLEIMNCMKITDAGCTMRYKGIWVLPPLSLFSHQVPVTIECHNAKGNFTYPTLYNSVKTLILNVSDNEISTLQDIALPDSLEWIDLRGNKIARLNTNDTNRLFARKDRRVWLSRNQIVCDCENQYLIDFLHKRHEQVQDFSDIKCIDTDIPLSAVTSYEVCQINIKMQSWTLALLIAATITSVLLIVAYWRYRFQIKLYLYSRGWCLSCLQKEDVDPERPFDAFLSFAHGDDSYVQEQFLPKLEGKPDNHKILVHYRDWVVGESIPAQIMNSIQRSKRTIILLSRNFVESVWCSLEFKYAVANAAQEERNRLLVLILDDVLSLPLSSELKTYVEFNTYLRCDDPWFWEKLRYAMPHKKQQLID